MTNTKTQIDKSITFVSAAAVLAILFIGCAEKTTPSSYDDNSAKWQQFKSKKAVDNIDK